MLPLHRILSLRLHLSLARVCNQTTHTQTQTRIARMAIRRISVRWENTQTKIKSEIREKVEDVGRE